MIFLETEGYELDPLAGAICDPCSAQAADLPTALNALHVRRAVNCTLRFSHPVPPLLEWKYPFQRTCLHHSTLRESW